MGLDFISWKAFEDPFQKQQSKFLCCGDHKYL